MAWWESPKSQLNNSKERSFYADAEADVADLPTSDDDYEPGVEPGSDCLVIETANVYMLDSTRTWSPMGGV